LFIVLRVIVYHCRSTAYQHVIAKAQHHHFNKLVIETHWWCYGHWNVIRVCAIVLNDYFRLINSSPSQKGVTIAKIGIAKIRIAKIGIAKIGIPIGMDR
jgi:hypothetical protein